MTAKVVRWLLFTVLFSLIPLAADYLASMARTNATPQLGTVIQKGELYLLSSAMAAVGLGEVFVPNPKWLIFRMLAGGSEVLIVGLSTALYTMSASAVGTPFGASLFGFSVVVFLASCVISTSCVVLSELQ